MEKQATQSDGGRRTWRQGLLAVLALAPWAWIAGCAVQPPAVTRLGDGVYRAPTTREAEAYCRNSGDPTRLIKLSGAAVESDGVLFRCD